MRKIYSYLLLAFLEILSISQIFGQGSIPSSDITLSNSGTTSMSVAWHPTYRRYYASSGGSNSSVVTTFEENGTRVGSSSHNWDSRGLWYNSLTDRIEGNDYYGKYGYYPNNGNLLSGNVVTLATYSPSVQFSQRSHVFLAADNEFYRREGATLNVYNSSGVRQRTVSLTLPSGQTFLDNGLACTDLSGKEIALYAYSSKRIYLFSKTGGSFVYYYQLPNTAPANSSYGFSFANNRFFISNSGGSTWDGYPITSITTSGNTCLPTNSVTWAISHPDISNPIVSYSWSFPDGQTSTNSSVTKVYPTAGTFTATCNVTLQDGEQRSLSSSITIYELPTTSNSGPDQAICSGSSITLAANTPTNGVGVWSLVTGPNTPTITNTASPTSTVTGLSTGTYNFKWTISNGTCPSSEDQVLVSVGVTNAGTLSGTQSICSSQTSQFTSTVSGGAWSTSNSNVATVDLNTGLVTGVAAGTVTITYTVAGTGGCANGTATRTVTVTSAPNAGTITGVQSINLGSTSQLTTNGNSGGAWTSSDINIATVNSSGLVTGVSSGSATITYTVTGTGGCANATATLAITIVPCDAGTLSGTQAICVAGTSQFSSNGTSGGSWATSSSSIAIVSSSGLVTGVAAGTATITYTVTGTGCSNSSTRTITVTAPPSAGTLSGTQEICVAGTATLASNAPQVQLDRGLHFVGGTLAANSDYVTVNSSFPVSTGDFTIEVWVKPGLIDNQYHGFFGSQLDGVGRDQSMWVGPNGSLHTDFNRGGTRYDMLTGDNFFTTNTWTHVAWVKEGTTFKLYKNGELVTSRVAPANATPGNGFYWLGRVDNFFTGALDEFRIWNVARTPSQIQLNMNQQISTQTNLVTYYDFNQGTANGTNTGVTTLTDRTTSALNGSLTGFALTGTTSNWIGGVDVNGTWTSSDASIATVHPITGLVTGVAAGGATITYTVFGNSPCSNATATRTVTVTAAPNAGTLSGNNAICVNGTTVLASSGSTGGTWTSSNTNVATLGNVANTTGGAVEWCVIYDYDAANSRYRVGIDSREFIGTGITPSTVNALKLFDLWDGPVTFSSYDPNSWAEYWVYTNTQFNYAGSAYSAYLRSGNGFYGVRAEFTFAPGAVRGVAAGTATITYTVTGTGGCADATATRTVTVSAPPTTGTLSGTQTVFVGATTTFASTVSGGSWTSSNASVAAVNASTGVVTGVATGTATITYTVAGTGGCSNVTATRTVTVYACPAIAALSPSADRLCAGTDLTLTAAGLTGMSSLSSGITFKYSTIALADPYVGGTVIATVANANLVSSGSIARTTTSLATGGTYYIYAILSTTPDGTGCRPFAATTVVVNPNGQVTLPANSIVCSGTSIAAQALTTTNSGGTTTYAWTNSATSIGLAASGSTATIPAFTATNTGSAAVTATISVIPTYTDGGLSCPGTASSYTITVNPVPSLTTVTDRIVCNGSSNTIALTGPVTGTVYNWTNSNTAIGLGASGTGNISFTATNAGPDPISGTVTVTPSYTNAGLTCTGSASSFTVTVNPNGQVNTVSNQVLCNGSATSTVTFTTTNNGLISTGGTQTASSGTISVSVPDASAVGATATIPVTLPTGAVINNMRVTLNLTHTWISDMVINLKAPNGQILNLFNQHGGSGDNLVNTVVSSTGTTAFSSGSAPFTGTFAATAASGQGPTGNVSNSANFAALYSTPNGNWSLALRDLFGGDVGVLTSWSISIDYTVQGTFGTNMNWTNSTTSIGLGASGTGNIPSFTAVNNGSAPVTSTVTVTPVYFNSGVSCPGTPTTFTYTVNPTPTVNAVVSPVFCAGTPSTVNFSGNATGTVYSWTNSNTAIGLAASGTGSLSFTPTNSGTTPIIATITVTPSFTNGGVTCTGTPRTFTITVNPVGQVNAVNSQVLCNGANTTAVNFATVNGGGTIVAGTPVVTNSGTISILVPDANAGGASHTIPVTLPAGATVTGVSVNFNMNHTWVSDMVFNLKAPNGQILNLVNRRGGAGVNFTNTNISSAGTASLATGAAPFTGTFAADAAIGVGPTGQLSSAANYAALYSVGSGDWTLQMRDYVGGDVGTLTSWSITINYTTLVPAVTSYAWTNNLSSIGLAASGTGNIASFAATNTTAAPVTATVTVTPTYTNAGVGCAGTPISYTYTINPTPTVNAVSNQTVCVGSNVAAVNYTGATTGTVYNWTNSNTAIGLAASGTGNIASFVGTNTTAAPISGTITVTPVYTNAGVTCTGIPRTFTITVNPIPTVNPVASFAACHNTTAAAAFSGATTGTVFNWTNSNPAIGLPASGSGNISFTALNTTSAPVTATITVTPSFTNGGTTCVGTPTSFVITVNPLPVVTTGALPGRICISDTLVRLNGTPVGGSWSGFGISGFNFMPPATDVGAWPITYTYADANGCVNRATTNVTVLACEERNRDLDNGAVILYPNPNSGQFNLRVNSTRFNVLGMKVYNTSGQLVYTNQWRGLVFARVIPVNLNNLAAGNYMIRLYYGDGMDRGADKTYQVIIAR